MAYQYLELETRGPVATVALARPPGNLLDIDVMEELNDALLGLRADGGPEVLVLRGAGPLFSEGLDFRDHTKDRVQRMVQVYGRIFETIRMMDAVSVAAVEGRAWGAGFELALGCNLIVAASDAVFALPEIRKGLIPPIAAITLPRVAPRRRAMEWILTGNEIPAAELERFGLVNRLLDPAGFDEGLAAFVAEITGKSGAVLRLARRAQFEAYYSTYEEALYKVQNIYLRELVELDDAAEGVKAHLEGRAPVWRNR